MSKICYVIMPYGGNDDAKQKHSKNVYNHIIGPAVRELGYEVIREDVAAIPGNITKNIVKHLAEADIVIADITNGNGNVFYELGIRHTMFKDSTILMIEAGQDIKFDISAYQTVQYQLDLDMIDKAKEDLQQGIQLRMEKKTDSDNLVHDIFPFLPENLIKFMTTSTTGNDSSNRISELTNINSELKLELQETKKLLEDTQRKLNEVGISNDNADDSLDEIFAKAEQASLLSGDQAILNLRKLSQEGNFDQQVFLSTLKKILEHGELSVPDYIKIAQICSECGLSAFQKLILEQAYKYASQDEDLISRLIDCYTDNVTTYDRALVLVNEWLGIQIKDNKLVAPPEKCRLLTEKQLVSFFNTYFILNKYDDIIYLSENYFLKHGAKHLVIIQRNLARAYQRSGNTEKAQATFDQLLGTPEGYKDDISHRMYGIFLDSIGRADLEYEQDEIAIALDPNFYRNYLSIAFDIFDDQYIRCEDKKIARVSRQESKAAAIPFVFKALEIAENRAAAEVQDILLRNHCESALEDLNRQLQEGTFPDYGAYNDFPLRYILEELAFEIEKKL